MKIFGLRKQPNTHIEVDLDEEWVIPSAPVYSKAQWTPFEGMRVKGRVKRVVLRGETVYVDGKILAEPGFGQDVRLRPPLSPPTPINRKKHSSHNESPSRKVGGVRARHNSEPPVTPIKGQPFYSINYN